MLYKDYLSKKGKYYTFEGLNLYKREELSERFNAFQKTKKISVQILDNFDMEYNLRRILSLYNLTLEEFEIEEIDSLILDYIIPINFTIVEKTIYKIKEDSEKNSDNDRLKILSQLVSSVWAICDSAGDALYMLDRMPAEMLLDVVKNRSEDLEKMYSTKEDKQKKEQKRIKEELLKKAKGVKSNES